jgi:hypothetical protein
VAAKRPPAGPGFLATLAWLAAVALFAAVAVSAVNRLIDWLGTAAGEVDERQTLAGLVAVTLFGLVSVCWLIGMAFVARWLGTRAAFGIGMAGTAAVRLAVALAVDAPLVSDWLALHERASAIASAGPRLGDSPIGYPTLLGALYTAFGTQVWLAETLNVVMALVSAAIVFDLLRRSAGPTAAALGIGLLAVMPSLALMTPLVSVEATYTTLLLLAIWFLVVLAGRASSVSRGRLAGWPATATASALAGVALGLSHYVRASSFVLLPAFVILALVAARDAGPRRAAAALVLAFGAVLAPVIADNWARHGVPSVETSSDAGFRLLVGTNQEADGRFNEADAELLQTLPGDTLRERSDAAGRLGIDRIADDPGGFVELALRKLVGMWGEDGYAVYFALDWQREPPVAPGLLLAGYLVSALFWAVVTLAAAWAVLRGGPDMSGWLLAAVLIGASLTVLHAFVEVQPRDHAYVTPLWVAAAAVALAGRGARGAAAPPPEPR